ncbi:restriction endonuclease subunit S [Treponema ruminis]|uniref:Type I restriction enzyme S subunit n=1 Tax=Treponema ruminis TaxID=744515 RepID=A0A7W8G7M4_9SPIR|nr:restriction endonuclease subunit S [Treponema ruminis]MBB5225358.1 type I restriction enzyme S subunit [Treponema ruminis]QSI01771.1 restriction endonuclease subunit S [Treponema ruminis]
METRTYTLKDISLNICDGVHNTVIDDENGDCLLLSAKNIQCGRIVFDENTDRKINRELCNKLKKRTKLSKNDIAITTVGANVGDLAIVGDGSENYEFQRSVGIIKANTKIADPIFLFYLLGTNSFNYYFHVIATGSAQPCLFLGTLNKIKVQLPPIPTQQKIASILSAYDNLIQNYKKQIEALQTAASELYKEWFVRFRFPGWQTTEFENGIPEGWKVERIGNVGEVIGGGTPSTENEEYWDGDIPWLSPVDLSDNTNVYVSRGSKNITELGLKKSSAKMMPKDTVLLSSRAPVGYVALAKNPICTNQGFKSVVCNTSVIQPIYLYYYFRMNKNYLQSIASGATFPELSGSMMKKIKVLLPPEKVQQQFSERANSFIAKAELLSEQITNLTQQRNLLLPRLMSGKLELK